MTISEWELWACAAAMIEKHGDDAAIHAAMKADALLAEGEIDGSRTWQLIIKKVNAFESRKDRVIH